MLQVQPKEGSEWIWVFYQCRKDVAVWVCLTKGTGENSAKHSDHEDKPLDQKVPLLILSVPIGDNIRFGTKSTVFIVIWKLVTRFGLVGCLNGVKGKVANHSVHYHAMTETDWVFFKISLVSWPKFWSQMQQTTTAILCICCRENLYSFVAWDALFGVYSHQLSMGSSWLL